MSTLKQLLASRTPESRRRIEEMEDLQDQAIRQHRKALRMPAIGGQFTRLAKAATREGQSHAGYPEALLWSGWRSVRAGRSPACRMRRNSAVAVTLIDLVAI